MCFKHNVNIKTMEMGSRVEAEQDSEGRGCFNPISFDAARPQPIVTNLIRTETREKV